jgi:hypothetical protein
LLQGVLDEAEAEMKAGRYEDSLGKRVWFHHNSMRIDRAIAGVRLSYA